jgi:hypothetical protein
MVSDIRSNGAHSEEVTRDALSRYVSFWSICVNTFTAVEREVVTDLWCQSLSLLVMVLHLKVEYSLLKLYIKPILFLKM